MLKKLFNLDNNGKNFLRMFSLVLYFSMLLAFSFDSFGEQQFSYLAQSFLKGRLDINQFPYGFWDTAYYAGNYYWPLGPFPAVLILPLFFVFEKFGIFFLHRYIHWLFPSLVFFLIYKISRKLNYSKDESLLWSFAFNLGSVFIFISTNTWGWYFSQVVAVTLIFLAIYEYLTKQRFALIGLYFSFLLLTRFTAFLGIVFFALEIFRVKKDFKSKVSNFIKLFLPVCFSLVTFLLYNYLRFGNPLEQGYSYQILIPELEKAKEYGLISLRHLPGNLYYFLFASPQPVFLDGVSKVLRFPFVYYDEWGLGIFFTSFYFIKLFFISYKKTILKNLLATSVLTAFVIFLYYGIGFRQFGYRYSLDFLPYLFLILMLENMGRRISKRFAHAVFGSIFFNIYLLFT